MKIIREKIPQEIIDQIVPGKDCLNRNEELRMLIRDIIRKEYLKSQKPTSDSSDS